MLMIFPLPASLSAGENASPPAMYRAHSRSLLGPRFRCRFRRPSFRRSRWRLQHHSDHPRPRDAGQTAELASRYSPDHRDRHLRSMRRLFRNIGNGFMTHIFQNIGDNDALAPASTAASANARPRPRAPPVTTIRFLLSDIDFMTLSGRPFDLPLTPPPPLPGPGVRQQQ